MSNESTFPLDIQRVVMKMDGTLDEILSLCSRVAQGHERLANAMDSAASAAEGAQRMIGDFLVLGRAFHEVCDTLQTEHGATLQSILDEQCRTTSAINSVGEAIAAIKDIASRESSINVNPTVDGNPMGMPGQAVEDARNPVSLKDFAALALQELRSIDEGGSPNRIPGREPWLNRIVFEAAGGTDVDGDGKIFGLDYIFDVPLESWPETKRGMIAPYYNSNLPRIPFPDYLESIKGTFYVEEARQVGSRYGWL